MVLEWLRVMPTGIDRSGIVHLTCKVVAFSAGSVFVEAWQDVLVATLDRRRAAQNWSDWAGDGPV